ncbi:MAG TPA: NAD-dependent epimerase/dehydratase family protein [Candidatus Paceibacterota bacterium]|nr:NAD-dependent epimerase/dehydratase family protein [Candidatus Paceibacterota bacterium]
MSETKAVVTGGAGFIGSHIVAALLERGFETHSIDSLVAGKREDRLHRDAHYHEADIRDTAGLAEIFKDTTYVFHEAALPRVEYSIQQPEETFQVNAAGTISVLQAARTSGVKRVVLATSGSVYGDQEVKAFTEDLPAHPQSPYAFQKYVSEHACRLWSELYGLPTVSLRYFNVYGPGFDPAGPYGLVVGKFLTLRKEGKPITIAGDGSHTRDYVHVKDVARANLLAAESAKAGKGEVINIGTGHETSVAEIAQLVGGPVEYGAARIEPARACADITRAKALLDWEPSISFPDGIAGLKKELGID